MQVSIVKPEFSGREVAHGDFLHVFDLALKLMFFNAFIIKITLTKDAVRLAFNEDKVLIELKDP
jgi:hypothetical protein